MKWNPAKIGGRVYDLSHLHPFRMHCVIPSKDGRPEQRYEIEVIFGLHCFTRGFRKGEPHLAELAYEDNREVRRFDSDRYELSKRLPEIVRGIHQRRCFRTGYGNFFTVELIGGNGEKVEYAVYFKVSRAGAKGRLNLFVQSAYVQDAIPRARPRPRKPIRFSVIAFNVSAGKPIKA